MSDLKERLRFELRDWDGDRMKLELVSLALVSEAADRIEQLEAALRQIARPVFVTEPAGTPESPWQVALRERIELAQSILGDTQ